MTLSGSKLTRDILIGLLAGAVVGLIINWLLADSVWTQTYLVDGLFDTVGQIFLKLLKLLIVPLVFVSLVCGTASLSDPSRLGRLGGKTLALYLATTAIAVTLALFFATLFAPGQGSDMAGLAAATFEPPAGQTFKEFLLGIVPRNVLDSMLSEKMLQLIFFSVLFGLAITFSGKKGEPIKKLFFQLNDVIMTLVVLVMLTAPFGVFALIAKTMSEFGLDLALSLGGYFGLLVFVLLFHGLVVYPTLLVILGRLNPLIFLKKMRAAMLFAFSTASSNATLPVTLRSVRDKLGVNNSVASFTVPLGATVNMDGTAIMQGVATVFIANVYAVDLTMGQLLTVVLTATTASIGTAGVPGVGTLMLATVLTQIGLPIEGIGLILGVDRLLDMTRTAVNITGDAAVTCIVAKSEGDLDESVFNDPNAGDDLDDDDSIEAVAQRD